MKKMDDLQEIFKVQLTDAISTAIAMKNTAYGDDWSVMAYHRYDDILIKLYRIESLLNTSPTQPDGDIRPNGKRNAPGFGLSKGEEEVQ